ncbi:efflux RND transporter periplasmic adaptor subunit [Mitsuaria sp. 7]|uniref:efflux RND transporter periplasmic adaptor subunit n=1 Tax=Mitsuaria sp. 7 TaxID=1658665 RepID=UPI0007DD4FDE|nr:efflux RND transporter periplasmic adaptor subunit [Mitsuaria sp. 7]ANH67672.1 RND transporter [Mitsuaria sp. 7]
MMTPSLKLTLTVAGAALLCAALAVKFVGTSAAASDPAAAHKETPALAVAVARLRPATLPIRLSANGNVTAWQEALIGSEASGLRLTEVTVNVGDEVRRGQVLATFSADTVNAELAQRRAEVAQAAVALSEASANAQRAQALQESGAMSTQQIQQYDAAARSAKAKLDAARAIEESQALKLKHTRVLAPDDGVISARAATVGSVVPAGQELFRMIRGGRVEWRAEIAAPDLAHLKPGQRVRVTLVNGDAVDGRVRMIAPSVDTLTRNGLVYVDLPRHPAARAGTYAHGDFDLGSSAAMVLPRSAVQMRDGLHQVMRIDAKDRVTQARVKVGRQSGDLMEILDGLDRTDRVVASGGAFLGDNDLVRVVEGTK